MEASNEDGRWINAECNMLVAKFGQPSSFRMPVVDLLVAEFSELHAVYLEPQSSRTQSISSMQARQDAQYASCRGFVRLLTRQSNAEYNGESRGKGLLPKIPQNLKNSS